MKNCVDPTRRRLLATSGQILAISAGFYGVPALADANAEFDGWMNEWMQTKALGGPLWLSRFADPTYFTVKPMGWAPGPQQPALPKVEVPVGFVTDLASVPRLFWSLLRPDGDYAYAAIVHDYLYWNQATTKAEADMIIKLAMEDLEVAPSQVTAIYQAVSHFGETAWKSNALLKQQGEKRILKLYPNDPKTRWSDWKTKPDVFA
jgi:hypothetical protein